MSRTSALRAGRAAVTALLTVAILTGCTVGPSSRPPLATSGAPVPVPTSGSPTVAAPPTGPGGPGREAAPIAWNSCQSPVPRSVPDSSQAFTLACGTMSVPADYGRPNGRTLSVRVTRALADGLTEDAPPLVMIAGPPGRFGRQDIAKLAAALPEQISARYAVVTLDLRGTGESAAVDCLDRDLANGLFALPVDPSSAEGSTLLSDLSREITFACTDEAGPTLSRFNTTAAADDLDSLRSALEEDQLTFIGTGPGATLGAVYADRYPGRVRRLVLDGPSDPLASVSDRAIERGPVLERAFDSFAAACADFDDGCPLGTDPRAAVTTLIDELGDIGTTDTDSHLVSGGTVLLALTELLPAPDRWPDLAAALAAAGTNEFGPVVGLLDEMYSHEVAFTGLGWQLMYRCNDTTLRLAQQDLVEATAKARETAPLFGPFLLGDIALCANWPAPEQALGRVAATGAPPLLLLGAVDDPAAPYNGVRSLAGQLSSATLLSWQSGRHGSFPASPCVTQAVNAYLITGAVPATGTLCPP